MAENKMKEVAQLLGVQLGEEFSIKGFLYNPYHFDKNGLIDRNREEHTDILAGLLTGIYVIEKLILTEEEKAYLEAVLRPFKDRVVYIKKRSSDTGDYILVQFEKRFNFPRETIDFPFFEKGTMYKGMEVNKDYTLKELRLFEDE